MDQYIERLSTVRLFADCDRRELKRLAHILDELEVAPDRELATQGAHGREAFIIVSGTADVVRDGEVVAHLGPGDYFGELALLDAGPRNASVVSTSPMDVLVMGRQQFNTLLDEVPGLTRRLLRSTAQRLREVSDNDAY